MFCGKERCTEECPAYVRNDNLSLTSCKLMNNEIRASMAKEDAYKAMASYWKNKD